MIRRYAEPISKEKTLNLFKDCLSRAEQYAMAHKLGVSLDKIDTLSAETLERQIMVYMRG